MASTEALIEGKTVWFQKEVVLTAKSKGCHLLDDEVLAKLPEVQSLKVGTAHVFSEYCILHSALNIQYFAYYILLDG